MFLTENVFTHKKGLDRYPKMKHEKATISYPFEVLRKYITNTKELNCDKKEESLAKLWPIYRSIRRIAYLALDSHYTPVPFSIDLTSIISNFNDSYTELFDMDSKFQRALHQLNDVMRTNIYMSSDGMLVNSSMSELVHYKLLSLSKNNNNLTWLKKTLAPNATKQITLQNIDEIIKCCYKEKDWNSKALVQLEFRKSDLEKTETIDNLLKMEIEERKKISIKSSKVAIHIDRTRNILNVVYALHENTKDKELLLKSLKILNRFILNKNIYCKNYGYESSAHNIIQCLQLVLKGIFGDTTQFRFDAPGDYIDNNLYAGYGSKKAGNNIKQLISDLKGTIYFSKDLENEINLTNTIMEGLKIRGAVACYTGSTKLFANPELNTETAEFDGLIVIPNYDPYKMFAMIIEAKNINKGHTLAAKQLKKRLSNSCKGYIDYEQIEKITNMGVPATP